MATKKPADPLAGLSIGTAKAAPTITGPTPASAPVINLNAAKKKRRLTGQAFKDAQTFARDMVGYDDTSPIWGKRLIVVISDVAQQLEDAATYAGAGDHVNAEASLITAHTYITELKKRLAYGQVMKAQNS